MAHAEDVDEDGDIDMLFHFRIADLELEDGVAEAKVALTGQLGSLVAIPSANRINDGTPISGADSVHILQPNNRGPYRIARHRPLIDTNQLDLLTAAAEPVDPVAHRQ